MRHLIRKLESTQREEFRPPREPKISPAQRMQEIMEEKLKWEELRQHNARTLREFLQIRSDRGLPTHYSLIPGQFGYHGDLPITPAQVRLAATLAGYDEGAAQGDGPTW